MAIERRITVRASFRQVAVEALPFPLCRVQKKGQPFDRLSANGLRIHPAPFAHIPNQDKLAQKIHRIRVTYVNFVKYIYNNSDNILRRFGLA